MYNAGIVLGTSTVASIALLPKTGGHTFATAAVALASGLIVWGALYIYNNK